MARPSAPPQQTEETPRRPRPKGPAPRRSGEADRGPPTGAGGKDTKVGEAKARKAKARGQKKQAGTMVNRSNKGRQIELNAIKLLESEGYVVHRCVRTSIRRGPMWISQSNDIFGCIDLVAKKRGERTRWVQVTADGGIGRKKDDLAEVPWDPLFDSVEIWRWVGGRKRRHKSTGQWLDRQYFQVYHFDESFELQPDRRIRLDGGEEE